MAQRELQLILDLKDNASKELKGFRGNLKSAGKSMKSVGGTMTRSITAPLVGAATAATKFAADFENNLKQTRAQAGLTAEEMEKVGEATEDIAVKTGESMDEIFEAQRLAQSSTLDLAEANELVEVSSTAAAAGLGEMNTLVNLGTTVAQKFGDSVGSAKEGIEVMAAAAQDSQTSVDQFADGLLKGSAQMGILNVSMQEGSTIFSRLSDAAANAEVAGTQFRAMLGGLQKPSTELEGVMNDVFGSTEQFREELEDNAIDALFRLKDGAESAGTSVEELMNNKRAAAGASNFFASSQETVNETLEKTQDSVGIITEMFSQSESFTRLLSRAFQALQKAMRPIGDILIQRLSPILESFIEKIIALSDWFTNLSPTMQNVIIVVTGIVAAIGPLLVIFGTILAVLPQVVAGFSLVAGVISGPVLLAIGAAIAIGALLITHWETIKEQFIAIWEIIKIGVKRIVNFIVDLVKKAFGLTLPGLIINNWDKIKKFFKDTWDGIKMIFSNAIDWIMDKLQPFIDAIKGVLGIAGKVGSAIGSGISSVGNAIGSVIPQLAEGGIVTRPTLAMVGEAGPEAVVPLDKGTGGGKKVVINVNGGTYLDRQAADEIFEQLSSRIRREFRL